MLLLFSDIFNFKDFNEFEDNLFVLGAAAFEEAATAKNVYLLVLILALLGAIGILVYNAFIRERHTVLIPRWLMHAVPVILFSVFATFGLTGCFETLLPNVTVDGILYFTPNHIGSVSLITDENGVVVKRYKYSPYGELLVDKSSVFEDAYGKYMFTAQEYDRTSGLYYYNARFYDPEIGRFITTDSIVPDPTNTQDYNRYMYCSGNPIKSVDPTGHDDGEGWGPSDWGAYADAMGYSDMGPSGSASQSADGGNTNQGNTANSPNGIPPLGPIDYFDYGFTGCGFGMIGRPNFNSPTTNNPSTESKGTPPAQTAVTSAPAKDNTDKDSGKSAFAAPIDNIIGDRGGNTSKSESPSSQGHRPGTGSITSKYGWRDNPKDPTQREWHNGIDTAYGDGKAHSPYDGIVSRSEKIGGFGNAVVVEYTDDKGRPTGKGGLFGHLSEKGLSVGTPVKAGQVVGKIGTTGKSTGLHLHYTHFTNVWTGTTINPLSLYK